MKLLPRCFCRSRCVFAVAFAFVFLTAKADVLIEMRNPDFERGKEGWILRDAGEGSEFSVVSDGSHSGSRCGKTSGDGSQRNVLIPDRWTIPVEPGQKYRVAAWARLGDSVDFQPGKGRVCVEVVLSRSTGKNSDGTGNVLLGFDGKVTSSQYASTVALTVRKSGWQEISGVFEIPEGVFLMGMLLVADQVGGDVFWDDVSVTLVNPETPLSPVLK